MKADKTGAAETAAMTIGIRITGCNGIPPSQPLLAEFNEMGGNIGRAEGNALVLHDPMRVISRTHASIEFRNGSYFIRNLGTAIPVYLNGQPLGNGRDAVIAAGDEIRIGAYMMEVTGGLAHAMADTGGPAGAWDNGSIPASNASRDDPLHLFEGSSQADPFGGDHGLFAPFDHPSQGQGNSARGGDSQDRRPIPGSPDLPGIIPPDFDPFGERPIEKPQSPGPAPVPPGTPPEDVLDLGFGPSVPNQSIDELFDLGPEQGGDPFAPDAPLAAGFGSLPGNDVRGNTDPLAAAGVSPARAPKVNHVQRDDGPELNASFRPPKAGPDPAMRPAYSTGKSPRRESAVPAAPVFSWEGNASVSDSDGIKGAIIPSPAAGQPEAGGLETAKVPGIAENPAGRPASAEKPASVSSTPPLLGERSEGPAANEAGTVVGNAAVDRDELLHALLSGAGVPDLDIPAGLTPQFMETLGQLLRESTQGTLDLLLARMLTKREVRADLTMIAPRENNPLKFSPSVEVALTHLLSPQGRGFMPPRQAMKDACNDLRSHQFGFMAGMRAALAGVLERFDPVQLEKRIVQKTVMDSILPINRKAKLWDLFAERYRKISSEAEEDFHVLFGKEFLRAYEAQIAKLEQDGKNGRNGNS
jgi:FHA domain-containing protein